MDRVLTMLRRSCLEGSSAIKSKYQCRRCRLVLNGYGSETTHVYCLEENAALWINCQHMFIFTDVPEDQEMADRDNSELTMVYLFEDHHCTPFEKKNPAL